MYQDSITAAIEGDLVHEYLMQSFAVQVWSKRYNFLLNEDLGWQNLQYILRCIFVFVYYIGHHQKRMSEVYVWAWYNQVVPQLRVLDWE